MRKFLIAGLACALVATSSPAYAAKPPDTWDGLLRVRAKKLDAVYLLPDADFRVYTKVVIDLPQMAFRKNWQRDYNSTYRGTSGRIDDQDVRRVLDEASGRFREILTKAYTNAGYQVVAQPGPDVLQLSTAVINIFVNAPDTMSAGRSRTYSREAGEATLVVEARDSQSGALLGRAVDGRLVGDNTMYLRNSVTNRADFDQVFTSWAKTSVQGLATLKSMSPVDADGALRK